MNNYRANANIKLGLFIFGLLLILGLIVYSNFLVNQLRSDNREIVKMYSEIIAKTVNEDSDTNLNFVFDEIIKKIQFPIIYTDIENNPIYYKNIDVESLEQVAEYKGKISTQDFGNMLVNVASEYNNALLVVENNNIGWAAIQQVIDREYPNLFYTSKDLQYVDVQHQITNKYRVQERNMVPGFSTTQKTRPLIVAKLEEMFREESVVVHSQRLIDELFVFIYNGNRAEAMTGYNDDLVMSFAIALWVRDTALRLRAEGIELSKRAIQGIGQNSGIYTSEVQKNDSWEMDVKGEKEDLTWLIK